MGLLLSKTITITLSKQSRKSKTCLINHTIIQKKLDSCQVFDSKKATEYHMKIMKQRECTTIQTYRWFLVYSCKNCLRPFPPFPQEVIVQVPLYVAPNPVIASKSKLSQEISARNQHIHNWRKGINIIPKLHEFNETINSHLLILLSGLNQTYATLCVFY